MKGILISICGYICLACIYCLAKYFPETFLYLEANTLIMHSLFALSVLFNISAVIFAIADFFRTSSAMNSILEVFSLMISVPYIVVAVMLLRIDN